MTYSFAGLLALIITLIINHDVLRKREGESIIPAQKSYRAFLICTCLYFVSDIIWGIFYDRHLLALTYADTVFYFVIMGLVILYWTRFVVDYLEENSRLDRMLMIMGNFIFLFQLISILVNFVRPVFFSFDADGVYHPEIIRYVTLAAQLVMFALTAVYALSVAAKSTDSVKRRHRTIGMFSVIMTVFDVLQVRYSLLPLFSIGCLLGICLLHSYFLENIREEYRSDLEVQLRDSIEKGNYFDLLTGLPSMTYFFELSEAAKKEIISSGGIPYMLYIDFSGMKFFNVKYGFSEGDRLLQEFARILISLFGSDRCCRMAGDHFAVVTQMNGMEERIEKLFSEFSKVNDGKSLPVHVGLYSDLRGDVEASTACDRAKLACSELSGTYASGFRYYRRELSDDVEKKRYITENIDRAVSEGWIRVYLQPIVRTVNERVCDVEALARWIDPERGFMSPADFIPALEESGQIYKLDLFMVDQILGLMKEHKEKGLSIIPHSINLSRSDFDTCDIVEEIRSRVDAAGVGRDRITIEITESMIGSDFEFIKKQVERFRSLGFPVWMDDFGSGYSSLDVLQSIRFDLLKFDMSFMRKLDEGEEGKIILTELMRMATSLGVDTVCEGVETEEQVRFLRDIGCAKLQGYYYSKPLPFEDVAELRKNGLIIKTEDPEESGYYESIGKVNLFDLGVVAEEGNDPLHNTFDTVPIAVIEVKDGKARYIRSNRSYREFVKRCFGDELYTGVIDFNDPAIHYGPVFPAVIKQCCENGNRSFYEDKMPDGSVVHSFAYRVCINPVTGSTAVAVAVLSVTEPDDSTTFADIARALAADYYNIFVIDLDTNDYIEYSSRVGGEELSIERHGREFFESARRDTMTRIYEDDREAFLKLFTKENVLRELDAQGVFTTTYRLIDTGKPMYVNMKITRMQGGNRIILGISIVDAQMKQIEEEKRLRQERSSLSRIASLAPDFIVLYTVDPETGHYVQYNPSSEYESFGLAVQGEDFFDDVVRDAPKAIDPKDMERHLRVFTKENVMEEIEKNGVFIHNYGLLIDGRSVPASLRATLAHEEDGEKIILGVSIDDKEN
ncbi:MAG: EAL domain-containing protein [Mogibacterium sp.]|nr:EAL domain-containing protein [Mogibacterium sp.]